MDWLVASLLVSLVLTVVLNVALRVLPGAGKGVRRWADDLARRNPDQEDHGERRSVQVWFPWKTMLAVSVVVTVVVNVVLLLS